MDDEDRQFLEDLANNLLKKKKEEMRNRCDESKATGAMAQAAREFKDFDADEREEAKEEEYDYFLDNMADENALGSCGYHVIDEGD
jgi:hypothetical protein